MMYKTKSGETLFPGDRCMAVSISAGLPRAYIGRFHGMSPAGAPQVAIPRQRSEYFYKGTEQVCRGGIRGYMQTFFGYMDDTDPKYLAHLKEFAEKVEERTFPGQRIATFPNGRLFKL